mgnify:CR=1 FL=1
MVINLQTFIIANHFDIMADLQNGAEIYGIALNGMCIIKVRSMMKIITYGILVLLINSFKKCVQEFSMVVAKTF